MGLGKLRDEQVSSTEHTVHTQIAYQRGLVQKHGPNPCCKQLVCIPHHQTLVHRLLARPKHEQSWEVCVV